MSYYIESERATRPVDTWAAALDGAGRLALAESSTRHAAVEREGGAVLRVEQFASDSAGRVTRHNGLAVPVAPTVLGAFGAAGGLNAMVIEAGRRRQARRAAEIRQGWDYRDGDADERTTGGC